jgi:excisionase family DNA binding protein
MTERLLTPADVADRCQISTKTVLRAIRSGRLRASRLGERGAYRVRVEDLDAWLQAVVVSPSDQESESAYGPEPLFGRGAASAGRLVVTARGAKFVRARPT